MDGRHARAVLGVPEHASADDIRRAFRQRALTTHPDRGGDRTTFELVVLAFETLQHVTVSPAIVRSTPEPAGPLHPRFSAYDCPRAPRPARRFEDALRVAMARQ
jgi:hypothetical protein